jgi:hypothetical protein
MGKLRATTLDSANALSPQFLFCPTEYCSALVATSIEESSYLATLGRELIPEVATPPCLKPLPSCVYSRAADATDHGSQLVTRLRHDCFVVLTLQVSVLWTGTDIISKTITCAHADAIASVLQRKVTIWDNLHANDYDNGRRLYLGPYSYVQVFFLFRVLLGIGFCSQRALWFVFRVLLHPQRPRGRLGSPRERYIEQSQLRIRGQLCSAAHTVSQVYIRLHAVLLLTILSRRLHD